MENRRGALEALVSIMFEKDFWKERRVFVTGHTGFKGSWLCLWLHALGAKVYGYALEPPTDPSMFVQANVGSFMNSTIGDIRNLESLTRALQEAQPEIIIHMAAQPLVRESYRNPIDTYATNVMGSVHLFETVRSCPTVKAVVNVTTDKCYENREWSWGYREIEPMGGFDPYSSSKACSELVTAAYRQSFLQEQGVALASARAGNVIGGGDWANDRLLPDVFRSLDAEEILNIRAPQAIRPWQHVLEPLSGYLLLAQRLFVEGDAFAEPWNFGPADEDARSVGWIIEHLANTCTELRWETDEGYNPHEAHYLKLDSSKAQNNLGWKPRWVLSTALNKTLFWHEAWRSGEEMQSFSLGQIQEYEKAVSQE